MVHLPTGDRAYERQFGVDRTSGPRVGAADASGLKFEAYPYDLALGPSPVGSLWGKRLCRVEGEGFEPSRDFDSPNPLSRRAH